MFTGVPSPPLVSPRFCFFVNFSPVLYAIRMYSLHLHFYSTPISIKVASEKQKNYARSMFNGPRCIIVARQVNFVPATSLNLESKRCWRFYATSAERQDNVFQNAESYCRLFNLIKTVIWGALICFIEITGVCFPTGSLKFLINRKVWYSLEMRTLNTSSVQLGSFMATTAI